MREKQILFIIRWKIRGFRTQNANKRQIYFASGCGLRQQHYHVFYLEAIYFNSREVTLYLPVLTLIEIYDFCLQYNPNKDVKILLKIWKI